MKPILSICIPTVEGREKEFQALREHLMAIGLFDDGFEIISCKDNKERPIGAKRQHLLDIAKGEYIVQIDDDDWVPDYFISEILKALESKPDCIGYLEEIRPKEWNSDSRTWIEAVHSNRFDKWESGNFWRESCIMNDCISRRYNYKRTIFHKDVIKTEIARQIGFNPTLRYAEDHDFSIKLKQSGLLKKEVFLDEIMYYYNDPGNLSEQAKKERYG